MPRNTLSCKPINNNNASAYYSSMHYFELVMSGQSRANPSTMGQRWYRWVVTARKNKVVPVSFLAALIDSPDQQMPTDSRYMLTKEPGAYHNLRTTMNEIELGVVGPVRSYDVLPGTGPLHVLEEYTRKTHMVMDSLFGYSTSNDENTSKFVAMNT